MAVRVSPTLEKPTPSRTKVGVIVGASNDQSVAWSASVEVLGWVTT